MLRQDIRRTYDHLGGNRFQRIIGCARNPGLHAVATYRMGRWLSGKPLLLRLLLRPLWLLLFYRSRSAWGIEISPQASIGGGLLIFHYGGIFIGSRVVIGVNCSVSHDVTIGLAGRGSRRGAPVMGDNVYIAPGAKVSGKITIGSNVKIGANAVVERSVPDNALVQVRAPQVVVFQSLYAGADHAGRRDG